MVPWAGLWVMGPGVLSLGSLRRGVRGLLLSWGKGSIPWVRGGGLHQHRGPEQAKVVVSICCCSLAALSSC